MTITELNSLLQEAIKEVESIGITTGEIDPDIELTRATRTYGECRKDNINNIYTIYISKYFLNNPTKQIKNTIVHEVLHTVPNIVIYTTGSGIVFGWKPHKISSDGIPGLCWDDDGYDFFVGMKEFRQGSTLLKSGLENGWELRKNADIFNKISIRYY